MYSRFDLRLMDEFYKSNIQKYLEKGLDLYSNCSSKCKEQLREFIKENGRIDGSSVQEHWFPLYKADVFISHSHNDILKAISFAGWLNEKFDLKVFIDSCIWGYCDDLLKQFDDEYCLKDEGNVYDYNLRNYTTAHIHIMLTMALTEMLDSTECVFFLNTPSSVEIKKNIEKIKKDKQEITLSPWIYSELAISSKLKSQLRRRSTAVLEHRASYSFGNLEVEYEIDTYLKSFNKIYETDIQSWLSDYAKENTLHPLDVLYKKQWSKNNNAIYG